MNWLLDNRNSASTYIMNWHYDVISWHYLTPFTHPWSLSPLGSKLRRVLFTLLIYRVGSLRSLFFVYPSHTHIEHRDHAPQIHFADLWGPQRSYALSLNTPSGRGNSIPALPIIRNDVICIMYHVSVYIMNSVRSRN